MHRILWLFVVVGTMLFSSCTVVRYRTPSLQSAPTARNVKVHYMQFLWGLVPGPAVSMDQCGAGGIKKMKVSRGLVDLIIATLTVGIVQPVKVKITCAEPPPQVSPQVQIQYAPQPQQAPVQQPTPSPKSPPQQSTPQ